MKNTEKNPKQPKVLIDVMSKTIDKLAKDLHLKVIIKSLFEPQSFADSIQQLKVGNNGVGALWFGEKRLQTDIGDQFIF